MFSDRVFLILGCGPAMLLAAGCSIFPPLGQKRMKADLAALHGTARDSWAALPKVPQSAATGWLGDFGSPRLDSLVQQAITANPDLQAAAARVRQATNALQGSIRSRTASAGR